MTFEEAIKKSIQKYYEMGDEDLESNKFEERKYTKKYFDEFEDELVSKKSSKITRKKIDNGK